MAFRCEVDDDIRHFPLKERIDGISIGDASLNEREIRV